MADEDKGTGVPDWRDGAWDELKLGGRIFPGIPSVEVNIQSNLDIKKPSGKRGGKSRDRGDEPCGIDITLRISPAERFEFALCVPLLKPRAKGDARDPLTIEHPNTAFWGITALQVRKVHSPMPSSKDDWIVKIDCIEFVADSDTGAGVRKTSDKARDNEDERAWRSPEFVDDDVAGSSAPSKSGAAEEGLGLPE